MRYRKFITGMAVFVTALAGLFVVGNHEPIFALQGGGAEDPLITRSYLEQRLAGVGGSVSDEIIAFLIQDITAQVVAQVGSGGTGGSGQFTPVHLQQGQILIGGEGTEIILRAGAALGYTHSDGIVDMTTGSELVMGDTVHTNHLLIIPRDDTRGAVVSSQEAWFIVRGAYTVR